MNKLRLSLNRKKSSINAGVLDGDHSPQNLDLNLNLPVSRRSLGLGSRASLGLTGRRSKKASADYGRTNSLSSRVSARFGFDAESVKDARLSFDKYMTERVLAGEAVLTEEVNFRILKTSVNAAIPRWTKLKGTASLGQGKLMCDIKKVGRKGNVLKTSEMIFDIGLIKSIGYKRKGVRDFTLSFHDSDIVINIVSETPENNEKWLIALFAEIRVQATIFDTLFRELINDEWTKILRMDEIDYSKDNTESNLTAEESQKLAMDEETMLLAETCLRESVDLWSLCRGKDHPDAGEAYLRLGTWLKFNARHQEGTFWVETAAKAKSTYAQKMKHEMNPAEVSLKAFEDTALEALRNPGGMQPIDQVIIQRKQNDNVDKKKRAELILQKMKEIKTGGPQAENTDDPFDSMI